MNEDWDGEEVISINDKRVPKAVRQHGKLFKNPARFVIDAGDGQYLLYAEDGELLDLVYVNDD